MTNIQNFLNKLSIGYKCRSSFITVRDNIELLKIVQFFYEKSWIKMYIIQDGEIAIYLRYIKNKPLFTKIKSISTPGHRKYISKKGIICYKKSLGGHGRILLHTSYGLITSKLAQNLIIGGEISYILYE